MMPFKRTSRCYSIKKVRSHQTIADDDSKVSPSSKLTYIRFRARKVKETMTNATTITAQAKDLNYGIQEMHSIQCF